MSNGKKARVVAHWDNLIERLKELNGETKMVLQAAKSQNDFGLALNAINRLERQIELESKLMGEALDLLFPQAPAAVQPQVQSTAPAPQVQVQEAAPPPPPPPQAPVQEAAPPPPPPQAPVQEAVPPPQAPDEEVAPAKEMPAPPPGSHVTNQAAIMFADIAGSTKLYEAIGDEKARTLTSACIDLLKQITEDHQGVVIKTIGDEVMCTFPNADLAAEASIRMQEDVEEHQHEWGSQLHIRVGFHYGDVIEENNDVFGDAVNLAARMAGQAKADQIITTGETLDVMSEHLSADSRELIRSHVKGKAEAIRICELTWGEEEELTIMGGMDTAPIPEPEKNTATVSFGGKEIVIDESNTGASMGRGNNNTFTVPDNKSSRAHAKFELRRGRIYLIDQSANGTYLSPDGGQMVFIHRDEHILTGSGVIGLGHEVHGTHELAIHYSCG
ncbi:MAG: adenylate/guanylate cyclase domain-containing protein [Magnetococcales bacterium]|nr:adenylate/guanylate cyclase domain-containing protein [Magnetococcales bacterium]